MSKESNLYRDAIRVLFILVYGSRKLERTNGFSVAIFEGKARLYAMDFWIRYPDYFAHELILNYKETGEKWYIEIAREIINNNEPDIRTIPMIRYLFGAYEKIDNILAVLVSKGLIIQSGTKSLNRIIQNDYLISKNAIELVEKSVIEFPILSWYEKRARLVVKISGKRKGSTLKSRQYEHIEYAKTKLGGTIHSIKNEVIEDLKNII